MLNCLRRVGPRQDLLFGLSTASCYWLDRKDIPAIPCPGAKRNGDCPATFHPAQTSVLLESVPESSLDVAIPSPPEKIGFCDGSSKLLRVH
jgi:hypothetical protein